jgi:hypothetical protein
MSQMRVDHIIYAVDDLEAAGRQLYEESGLASIEGGRHPAWGTANRIVPLGTAYLELITVVDRDVAAFSDFGRPVMDAIAAGRHLVGWVVATDDLDAISRRLGLDVSRGARTRPDGIRLSWQLAGVARALTTGALPIFIEWGGSADLHPGKAEADHRLVPTGIAWIEVVGDEQALRSWLGDFDFEDFELRFVNGAAGLSAVAIGTGAHEIVLR